MTSYGRGPRRASVTVNSDMGEGIGIHSFGNDERLLGFVDTVNVACGMHAGDPSTIARTVEAALAAGVTVGAHPGLPDLAGFGRREMAIEPLELRDLVRYQVGAVAAFVQASGGQLHHIKPHGALYMMVARQKELMEAVCEVAEQYAVPVFGLASTQHQLVAEERGVPFVSELYVDLDYDDDGLLILKRKGRPTDLDDVESRTVRALEEGAVLTASGHVRRIKADSICVHSDVPNAPDVARRVRHVLDRITSPV